MPPILLGCRLCCFILRSESDNSKKRKKEKYSKSISPIQSFSILFSHPFCKVTEGSPGSPTLIHHSGICSCSLRNVQNGLTGEKPKKHPPWESTRAHAFPSHPGHLSWCWTRVRRDLPSCHFLQNGGDASRMFSTSLEEAGLPSLQLFISGHVSLYSHCIPIFSRTFESFWNLRFCPGFARAKFHTVLERTQTSTTAP